MGENIRIEKEDVKMGENIRIEKEDVKKDENIRLEKEDVKKDENFRLEKEDVKKDEDFINKDFINKDVIDKHLKIGKNIAGKVANDFGQTMDDVVLNLKSLRKDVDSKIKDYTDNLFKINIDLLDLGNAFYLKADLPGVKKESINVEIAGKDLTIQAYFTGVCDGVCDLENKEHQFLIKGRNFGDAKRTINLPQKIKIDDVKGELDNGVLSLNLPKIESKKVKINFN
ncbi:MAG: Hsp20/alpha crystallin family protein [Methanobrevibacter sp.]|jgi:HSP20 family protein|nr:Hsp20/alpha crystallin family protein [Candidatus Methanovirga basalitermitum]